MRLRATLIAGVTVLAAACRGGVHPAEEAPRFDAPITPAPVHLPALNDSNAPAAELETEGSPGCGTPLTARDTVRAIDAEQAGRSYRVHLPPAYQPANATPMVLNFHGYARDALQQETYSGLAAFADDAGFIVVTPDGAGSPLQWNIIDVYGDSGSDDVAFTAELVGELTRNHCIDLRRIFATGISNGGEMAAQVACLLPDIFAAVAPVAGVVYQGCSGRPVPVVSFHGTQDYNVPFEFAQPAMAEWAAHNGCEGIESGAVSAHVTRESYGGCSGADVVLYVIEGGGHTWPDAEDETGGVGPTTHEINANTLMWEFFKAHPMPAGPG